MKDCERLIVPQIWQKPFISYRLTNHTQKMNKNIQEDIISKAFSDWSFASRGTINFYATTKDEDISISFVERKHDDCDFPMDGAGGVLGHAFFPAFGGNIHLDKEEAWGEDCDLYSVILHEIGHSLGLRHSELGSQAVMAPVYKKYSKLESEDIERIYEIYSKKDLSHGIKSLIRNSNRWMALLENGNLHRIHSIKKDGTFQINKVSSYNIEHKWPGIPSDVDATVTWRNGLTVIIKGSLYWIIDSKGEMKTEYPKKLNICFPQIPSNQKVKCAFYWPENESIYLLMDNGQYYRFTYPDNPTINIISRVRYPKIMQNMNELIDICTYYTLDEENMEEPICVTKTYFYFRNNDNGEIKVCCLDSKNFKPNQLTTTIFDPNLSP